MESAQVVPGRSARVRVGLGAAVVLVLVAFGIAVLVSIVGSTRATDAVPLREAAPPSGTSDAAGPAAVAPSQSPSPALARIFVHILGAVERPGLYELRTGGRAIDAVAAAGGFTATADQKGLNLARLLVDGEQIVVPVIGEVLPAPPAPPGAGGGPGTDSAGGLVNLNTADSAALDTLPGVGPATAARILEWRETNGGFTSVEDLQSVSGIGEKTFAELKDLVTV